MLDDFDAILGEARRIVSVSANLAVGAFPHGATLSCRCGHKHDISTARCARFLTFGWPTHCGETMTATALTPTPERHREP